MVRSVEGGYAFINGENEHYDNEPEKVANNVDVFKELNNYQEYCRNLMNSPATDKSALIKASDVTKILGQIKKITDNIVPELVIIDSNSTAEVKQQYFEELISLLESWIDVIGKITEFEVDKNDFDVQNVISNTWLNDFFSEVKDAFDSAAEKVPDIIRKSHDFRDDFLARWLVAFRILLRDSIIKRIYYVLGINVDELQKRVMKFEEKIKLTEKRTKLLSIVKQSFIKNKKEPPASYLEKYILGNMKELFEILQESEKLIDDMFNVILTSKEKYKIHLTVTTSLLPVVKKLYLILSNNKQDIIDYFGKPIFLTVKSLEQNLKCFHDAIDKATSALSFDTRYDDNISTMKLNDFKARISDIRLFAKKLLDSVNFSIQVAEKSTALNALKSAIDFNHDMTNSFWNYWLKNDYEKLWDGIASFRVDWR